MKTKSILITALALCSSYAAALAANDTDLPFYDSTHCPDVIELNPHLSIGLSTVVQNYGSIVPGLSDFLLSPGCQVKAGFDVRFNIRNSFGLYTGLEFGINNTSYTMSLVDNSTSSISSFYNRSHFYEFTVPVCVSWRFNLGTTIMWNVDLGTYLSHGTGGTMKSTGYSSGENAIGQPIVSNVSHETQYFDSDQPIINSIKRTDYGPRIATGLIYKHKYAINTVFQLSLPNRATNFGVLDVKYRHLSLAFQFGYLF